MSTSTLKHKVLCPPVSIDTKCCFYLDMSPRFLSLLFIRAWQHLREYGKESFFLLHKIFSKSVKLLHNHQAVSFLFALHIFCKNPAYLGFFRVKQDFDQRGLSAPKKMFVKNRIDVLCNMTEIFAFWNCSRISSLHVFERSKKRWLIRLKKIEKNIRRIPLRLTQRYPANHRYDWSVEIKRCIIPELKIPHLEPELPALPFSSCCGVSSLHDSHH